MKFLLSGYFGYDNAGDEAVLSAMLSHLQECASQAQFLVTSGDPNATQRLHQGHDLRALGRQNPRQLLAAMRECDVFLSGGGSLLQDVTSLRNVVYYAGLMRLARLARKPLMIYAQGVGPLNKPLSRKLARAGINGARVVTVRDEGSKTLLQRIGVRRLVEVTADPVWALEPEKAPVTTGPAWGVSLRSWGEGGAAGLGCLVESLRAEAEHSGARLRFFAMQPDRDEAVASQAGAKPDEIVDARGWHPRRLMGEMAGCERIVAMRLHALIFAGACGVPCVGVNYDPKVQALCEIIGAPLLNRLDEPGQLEQEVAGLPNLLRQSSSTAPERRAELRDKARRNAALASAILSKATKND